MDTIWFLGMDDPISVQGVLEALSDLDPPSYNTVKTTMERLVRKGILARHKVGRAYFYTGLITPQDLERRIIFRTLEHLVALYPVTVKELLSELSSDRRDNPRSLLTLATTGDRK